MFLLLKHTCKPPPPPVRGVARGPFFKTALSLVFMINDVFACEAPMMDKLTEVL